MPKTPEFATWVANMANSIPDNSNFVRPRHYDSPTNMQIRMMFADMLVPVLYSTDQAYRWMRAFLGVLEGDELIVGSGIEILGFAKADEYYDVDEDDEVTWILKFRKDVQTGWTPKDL